MNRCLCLVASLMFGLSIGVMASAQDEEAKETKNEVTELKSKSIEFKGKPLPISKGIEQPFLGGKLVQGAVDTKTFADMPKETTGVLLLGDKQYFLSKSSKPKKNISVVDGSGKSIDASSVIPLSDIPSDEVRISVLIRAIDPSIDLRSEKLVVTLLYPNFDQSCSNCWASSYCKKWCTNPNWYCDWWDGCEPY